MNQKIIKVGTSLAVTIPKKSTQGMGLKAGNVIKVNVDTKKKRMIIEFPQEYNEISDWTDNFIETYKDALKELADK